MLTQEQTACVETTSPAACVVAGAGAGKTTVIVNRVKELVSRGSPPQSIIVVTFSKRAADEIKTRLAEEDPKLSGCLVGTFHAIAYELMPHKPVVLSESASKQALERCFTATGTSPKLMKLVDHYRIGMALGNPQGVMPAADMYLSQLAISGESDYLGLLTWMLDHTACMWVSDILVDEAQDNEPLQWEIVRRFQAQGADLFCVMDPRQQIYGWRNADYKPAYELTVSSYPLPKTFRLTKDVTELANMVAADVHPEMAPLETDSLNEGLLVTSRSISEIVSLLNGELFTENEIVVLCRTNATVARASEELRSAGYKVSEQPDRTLQLEPLLRWLNNPSSESTEMNSLSDEILSPPVLSLTAGDAPSVVQLKVELWLTGTDGTVGDILSRIIFFDGKHDEEVFWWNNYFSDKSIPEALSRAALLRDPEPEVASGIRVMTVHQAKGLEFPAVIAADERFDSDTDEAKRLAYVEITRAMQRLVIMDTGNYPCYLARMARKLIFNSRILLHEAKSACTLTTTQEEPDGTDCRQENPEYAGCIIA